MEWTTPDDLHSSTTTTTATHGALTGLFDSAYASCHSDQSPSQFAKNRQLLLFLLGQTKTLLDGLAHASTMQPLLYPSAASQALSILSIHSHNPVNSSVLTNSFTSNSVYSSYTSSRGSHKNLPNGIQANDASLASALLQRINDSVSHIENLEIRIADTHSRVLVTGDVNAGKSTFVNTLLRRQIVPDDQEPCTALFVEVMDPQQNGGVEEFHAIKENVDYHPSDRSSFTRFDLHELRSVVEINEPEFSMIKVYCMDNRDSVSSLLHNGVVDISFIDSPGLNIDSVKTTSLFTKQEEIDVIVFVVRAENHFTQSSCDFLATACKEKASVFIVVNRFDQIRRKDRCRREILDQIQGISQHTFADAANLVHFVSARMVLESDLKLAERNEEAEVSFKHLEQSLRSFVLEKRSRSKLGPAKVYLGHILSDVAMISEHNKLISQEKIDKLSSELDESTPVFERMVSLKEDVLSDIDRIIGNTSILIESHSKVELGDFIAEIEPFSDGVQWDGIMHAWHYAHNLRQVVFRLATIRIRRCQDYAREHSIGCIKRIEQLATDAMSVPPEISTAPITAAFDQNQLAESSPEEVGIQMSDLFDLTDRLDLLKDYIPGITLITGALLGYKGFASGMLNTLHTAGALRMTKLAFTGIGLAGIGIILYAISDMKSSIQRKVIRKLQDHFAHSGFVEKTTTILFRTSRQALQSTIWEFQNQFQHLLAESEEKIIDQNIAKKSAQDAHDFYEGARKRAAHLQSQLDEIDLDV
ncbi:hypothetical protein BATDEDRAFT_34336 [Batrachochytrium dendrobatidis JAM81]|uniref:Dynamin-type G domain-containing protein n=2 Tax=Batrachochytrium dendrobatidis TaxID=109871 RepID=F4NX40_BATDJ|nr:mitofusin [Batrachochytrium dendrobatidis JAM81]EGF82290.1 hypothetical protein BATDEDRAFT_34336 [Batrachochytrium dendrobatidis JAM81]KAJ8328515.1 mitofusin [Batrachochytrium dendrobatidis]KAK5666921.1 mitofusin [Batrachochytrium dendrobatidis]OAJ40049.1 hypothetical protein BDEG_23828 [Batrachochytrium dendrobatidis JEL423]|eukprot:XP_006676761.1 hypothetical protein BATDEDRAFT_34336 [Batrachochytrium dendrobatidis JAM81]